MKQILGKGMSRYVLMAALLFLAAGCNSGSTASGDATTPVATSLALPTGDTFAAASDNSTGDASDNSASDGSGTTVAKVHNPEPASMALMGLGLLGLIRRRKKGAGMKGILSILAIISVLFMGTASASAASFVNGGFENGSLSGWTGGGGNWSDYGDQGVPVYVPWTGGALPTATQYAGGTPNNALMSGGTDPFTGAPTVYNGSYSVRINDSFNNYSVSTLSQSVSNYTDSDIYFAWNAVLESSHGLSDSDYFALILHDDTTNTDLVSRSYSSAGSVGSGTGSVIWSYYGGWYSAGWVQEHIDLAALNAVGDDLTLSLLGSDCPYGGHAGYVYLDGFSNVVVNPGTDAGVPEPASMILMGIGLAGAAMRRKRA